MTRPCVGLPLRAYLWSIVFIAVLAFPRWAVANGSDLPPEIVLQGFVKLEDGRAHLLVRLPLLLFSNFSLPKRGPGYLDLENIEPKLKQVANATSHLVELSENGVTLAPTTRDVQLSLLSDRSFASYSNALAHLQGPPLPVSTDLFWNQGFFDVHFEYSLQSRPPQSLVTRKRAARSRTTGQVAARVPSRRRDSAQLRDFWRRRVGSRSIRAGTKQRGFSSRLVSPMRSPSIASCFCCA